MSNCRDLGINYEEVLSKVGSAIDNCSYLDKHSAPALFELAIAEARRLGVDDLTIKAWVSGLLSDETAPS